MLALSATPSSALVVVISDLAPGGSPLEDFFNNNFTNVTEIRHANFANSTAQASLDALNGTGAHAGNGAADVFVIGRSLGSAAYSGGAADGWNAIGIPFVNLTSYTARETGDRLGWHTGGAGSSKSRNGDETTVSAGGAGILGLAAGDHDLWIDDPNFNGLGTSWNVGGGTVLSTIDGDLQAAFWNTGDAPGNPTSADVATFPAPRLLFSIDNEPNDSNNGVNDLTGLTPAGLGALVSAIDYATPLTAVPEPSAALLGFAGLGLLLVRRRR